ncbi:hypothetical protein CEW81_14045 [Kluyvera genomosp. 3]|uniref:Autotransporter outer membrane beta-barrel domain-containing protein n=1 Tax=Kluyvera genomosp. 3 TaxID=2774055 RepID=A0A248KIZ3_9ENTR|nr:hypothetical protein CEW81_14045 [Kluyvera genomosp. 3]
MVEGGGVGVYGGSANYTTVNAGALYVHEGMASNTTVNGTGIISVSGTSDHTILNGNSTLSVRDNGTALDTVINNSAVMYIYDNATVSGTTINGGKQEIFSSDSMPTVTDTIINDGTQIVHVNTVVGIRRFMVGASWYTVQQLIPLLMAVCRRYIMVG